MTTPIQNPGCCNRGVTVVLIDADIDGIEEKSDLQLTGGEYQDPDGTEVDSLSLWAYQRQTTVPVQLKYYRTAVDGDVGYESGKTKLILVTEEKDDGDDPYIHYATKQFIYDEGKKFTVGTYTRADYPTYPDGDAFPPEDLPDGFSLNKRYRGIAVNGVLVTAMCKVLPAPALP